MKKISAVFLALAILVFPSCEKAVTSSDETEIETALVTDDSNDVTTEELSTNDSLGTKEYHISAVYEKEPFEEALFLADYVARGRCLEKVTDEPRQGFVFEITENIYGAEDLSEIFVHKQDTIEKLDDMKYEVGKEYFLLLIDGRLPYTLREEYRFVSGRLYLPVEDITKSTFFDEPLLENAYLKELSTSEEFENYLREMIRDPRFKTEPFRETIYLEDTSIENVITNSPFVLRVNVGEEQFRRAPDRINHYCTVTECIKGDIEEGKVLDVIFTNDTVKEGDDVIVALSIMDSGLCVLTSRASVFTPDKYDEIKAIVDENNPS